MPRQYSSFLVRCWSLEHQQRRIEIEHVQSGAQAKLSSMEAAYDWMEARMAEPAPEKSGVDLKTERAEPADRLPAV